MSGKHLVPEERAVDWTKQKIVDRVIGCRVMLAVHGFISPAEKRAIDKRIDKWMALHGYERTKP